MGYFVVLLLTVVAVIASSHGHSVEAAIMLSAAGICFVLEPRK